MHSREPGHCNKSSSAETRFQQYKSPPEAEGTVNRITKADYIKIKNLKINKQQIK